jgi:GT2 family glycosyltransferase
MTRPAVTVVMPFAGDAAAARAAVRALRSLDVGPDDELILADNAGVAVAERPVTVVRALAERSPAYARNAGAERARGEWILFLDADCRAPRGLLAAYFSGASVAADVGALAGEVVAAPDAATVAGRYGAAKSFLSQQAHLAHPYRPRAVAANLMVRRAAFEQVGGFYEGIRAAEDTDFSWRLQQAGWRLELRPDARVEHAYRTTVRELRKQWRGYAAGRAWLARRYEGFAPEPAVRRGVERGWRRVLRRRRGQAPAGGSAAVLRNGSAPGRVDRGRFLALDALLAFDELAGLTLSNRPARNRAGGLPVQAVLVTDRFPARGDPLAEFARALERARVEAVARPELLATDVARELRIDYREDDGAAARTLALLALALRHPLRCVRDLWGRTPRDPSLIALAPAARRLERDPAARVQALGGTEAHATARRLAALSGRRLDS